MVAESLRGFAVATFSVRNLDAILPLRFMLECDVITQSTKQGNDDREADLLAAFDRLCKLADFADTESPPGNAPTRARPDRAFPDNIGYGSELPQSRSLPCRQRKPRY